MAFASSQPLLSVAVVLHYSQLALLRDTLQSLFEAVIALSAVHPGRDVELVLLDNSCDERYFLQLEALLDSFVLPNNLRLQTLQSGQNQGFGHGHNEALTKVSSRYHLILNPDVELAADALLKAVSRFELDSDIALLSPYVRDESGQQVFLCKAYPSVGILLLRAFAPSFVKRCFYKQLSAYELREQCAQQNESDVPLVSGCFMFARTSTLREVGGFDERFFLYFEDFDLSKRLGEHGRVVYCPSVSIAHYGGYAARKGLRHITLFLRSGCQFFHKHGWRWF